MTGAAASQVKPGARQITLLLAGTMTIMAGATISPALPQIEADVATGPNGPLLTRLVLTIPALFTALTALAAGAMLDRFGRRRILVGAILLYGIAGPAGALASSVDQLLIARALLGVAVGVIMTAVVTLITDYYDGPARGTVMGRQAAFSGGSGIVFLLAGGALADLSWRAPFGLYLLAFPILAMVLANLDEPKRTSNATPDAPLEALRLVPVAGLAALAFVSMVLFYLTPVQVPFHLAALGTASGTVAGGAIATLTLTGAIASALYGRVRARLGYGAIFAVLYLLMASGYGVVATASGPSQVVVGLALFGCGFGLLLPALQSLAAEIATPASRGTVIGTLTTALFLGQFASPFAAQPIVAWLGSGAAFALAGAALGLLAIASGLRTLLTPDAPHNRETPS
ncbi:MFS transporter [Jannaschia aquimarina]|uniref:PcaK protein n=1 Tax=Jannaschia aquimarina TaxID=935700 RepID=A0A0D1EJB4_9RHOB|nr:MFS transporter [Jannaschia aquimarina]KIT17071.1 4-hydroxybenzoate transporter PcaK [Jannaschia aquimarina]SNS82756.1 Predicted arabinose efflux permease, MFS family [Jannaschia aquimarina]